jgi:hypothetical protein
MSLYEKIIAEYPELEGSPEFINGSIRLQNDGDGDYIAKWEYSKPLPKGLKIGKDETNEL